MSDSIAAPQGGVTSVHFTGQAGRLEGRFYKSPKSTAPIALVLHPHPEHGGDMNAKANYRLFKTFVESGFSVLRFNFRGVGLSQGVFDGGTGEVTDAAHALDWLQRQTGQYQHCWIGGFSFGAWVGLQLIMRRPECQQFVAVAPTVNQHDFSGISPCAASGLVVSGAYDEVVPEEEILRFKEKTAFHKGYAMTHKTIEGANHFFDGHLTDLDGVVSAYINQTLGGGASSEEDLFGDMDLFL
jgi:alpha/beta superfamily hydrolase